MTLADLFVPLGVLAIFGFFIRFVFYVVRLNGRMPELWALLEQMGRSDRVHELCDGWSNLPATRYLYNEVDCEAPEIEALKHALRADYRSAMRSISAFGVALLAAIIAGLGILR